MKNGYLLLLTFQSSPHHTTVEGKTMITQGRHDYTFVRALFFDLVESLPFCSKVQPKHKQ